MQTNAPGKKPTDQGESTEKGKQACRAAEGQLDLASRVISQVRSAQGGVDSDQKSKPHKSRGHDSLETHNAANESRMPFASRNITRHAGLERAGPQSPCSDPAPQPWRALSTACPLGLGGGVPLQDGRLLVTARRRGQRGGHLGVSG